MDITDSITFEQFIKTYNFRNNVDNTKTIRVYLSINFDDWFEFGVYDYDSQKQVRCMSVLNKRILDSTISSFYYDTENDVFSVFLNRE